MWSIHNNKKTLSKCIKKQHPTICCLQAIYIRYKDTYRLKVKGQMKIYLSNTNQKKTGVAIIISGKVSFRGRIITRD